jgi:uncharacterized protein with HEPN domain
VRDPKARLLDILDAIAAIERHAHGGKTSFLQDELIFSWMVRQMQIIGEASRMLPEAIRARAVTVPWAKIIGMRNVVVHDYVGVDPEVVWDAIENDLPALKREVQALLRLLDEEAPG